MTQPIGKRVVWKGRQEADGRRTGYERGARWIYTGSLRYRVYKFLLAQTKPVPSALLYEKFGDRVSGALASLTFDRWIKRIYPPYINCAACKGKAFLFDDEGRPVRRCQHCDGYGMIHALNHGSLWKVHRRMAV
jgi:hypothetical protein